MTSSLIGRPAVGVHFLSASMPPATRILWSAKGGYAQPATMVGVWMKSVSRYHCMHSASQGVPHRHQLEQAACFPTPPGSSASPRPS